MTGVRVKALVWICCADGTTHDEGCQYEIERCDLKWGRPFFSWRVVRGVTGGGSYVCDAATLAEAQAAAQTDYETRIRAALEPQDAPAMAEELVALRAENARLSEERDANEVERVSLWCQRDKMKAALDAMVLFFEADEAADEARRAGNEADAERYAAMAIGRWQNIPSLIDAALTPPASQEGQADG